MKRPNKASEIIKRSPTARTAIGEAIFADEFGTTVRSPTRVLPSRDRSSSHSSRPMPFPAPVTRTTRQGTPALPGTRPRPVNEPLFFHRSKLSPGLTGRTNARPQSGRSSGGISAGARARSRPLFVRKGRPQAEGWSVERRLAFLRRCITGKKDSHDGGITKPGS